MIKKLNILLFSLAIATNIANASEMKTVAITQIVEHPALDACRKGVEDSLKNEGFIKGKNLKIIFENAQGQIANTISIAKKFAGKKPDVIVAIATPSAQAVAKSASNINLVFSAITDPIGAGLVKTLKAPGGKITGVSDLSPVHYHLDLVKTILPNIKKIGVVYNSGEANSMTLVNLLKKASAKSNIKVVEAIALKSSEVLTATRSLIGKVDAIYIPTDNTIVSAFEAVVKVGQDAKIPVFAGDTSSVKRGAIAALGFDYYDVGIQTGKMVADVLNGKNPGSINIETVSKLKLSVNLKAAEKMGIKIPNILQILADEIIK
jgi:putative ABC transport system substrate-binding protein